ncbi:hypothetical protein [uncultured Pedobacter sp.]|uniref:hypothetical protein n=1 Tax=uncultured Pedobacter sp. TaxID=246139 RepID=UPI0025D24724|nr:hypothetical protein [uncultured Pedobacter sp.]
MKRLFIALAFTAMGFGAFAGEVAPTKALPLSKNTSEKKVAEKQASKSQRRKTKKYVFHLTCGDVVVNVYTDAVNAPGVMSGIWNHLDQQNCH